jgi:hypothetical protein
MAELNLFIERFFSYGMISCEKTFISFKHLKISLFYSDKYENYFKLY